jgi:hypothetical protein
MPAIPSWIEGAPEIRYSGVAVPLREPEESEIAGRPGGAANYPSVSNHDCIPEKVIMSMIIYRNEQSGARFPVIEAPARKIDRWVMMAGFIVLAVILTVECAAVLGTSEASASYRHDSPT